MASGGPFDKAAARAAHDLVMKPILPLLEGKTRVLLSPDGALSVLPFAALVDEEGKHLVERLEITYLTSGRDLLRLANPVAPGSGAMVVANPAFGRRQEGESALALLGDSSTEKGDKGPSRGLEKAYFEPLPGTAGEARAVGALLPRALVRVDLEATESALKNVRAPRMLHVATHGFFLPAESRAGQAAAAGERGLELEYDEPWSWLPDDPLLRSGLALAGANAKNGGEGQDGILTALEASSLDLRGTKLVVLSACETGLGDVLNGEGVYGLRRALFVAGAETLVTSFWKVADEETRDLMVGYYERLQSGAGRSAALREAQLAMLGQKGTAHPYFWASFGVFGDPSPLGKDPVVAVASNKILAKPGVVAPGARGCACSEARGDGAGAGEGAGMLAALGAFVAMGRGRRRRSSTQRSA
jgi:CHAT domain-containing protein